MLSPAPWALGGVGSLPGSVAVPLHGEKADHAWAGAAGAPPSKLMTCEVSWARTSSPPLQWTKSVISLAMIPGGSASNKMRGLLPRDERQDANLRN